MKTQLLFFFLLTCCVMAKADDFRYTNINIEVGRATFDDDLIFLNETLDPSIYYSFGGAYQTSENIAYQISSSRFYSRDDGPEVTYSFHEAYIKFPFNITPQINLDPFIGYRYDALDLCLAEVCEEESESSIAYGLALRGWLRPSKWEIDASYTDAKQDGFSSEVEVGARYFIDQNRSIRLSHQTDDYVSIVAIAYSYFW